MDKDYQPPCPCVPCRWILSIMAMFGFAFVYALRINLSMAIVCMVIPANDTPVVNSTDTPDSDGCGPAGSDGQTTYPGEFNWDKSLQGHILNSFFYGYLLTQVVGGWLALRLGGKRVYGVGMLVAIVATLLTPVGARLHVGVLIFLRVMIGAGTGVTFPANSAIMGKWAPPMERSKLLSVANSGSNIGNVLTLSLSGLLCASGVDGGWPLIFYLFGGMSTVWLVGYAFLVYSTPAQHPRITWEERHYIETSLGEHKDQEREPLMSGHNKQCVSKTYSNLVQSESGHSKLQDCECARYLDGNTSVTPWIAIITSGPVWAMVIAHACANWGGYTLLTSLPLYMSEVLRYDIKQNGLLSSMPYIVQFITCVLGGQLADFIRRKRCMGTTATRKTFQIIGFTGSAIFMIATGFVECEQRYLGVVFLALATGFTFGNQSGFMCTCVDIAPRYAGIIFGISNTVATVPGIVAPLIVGELTQNGSREEWQRVFYICAGVYAVGGLVYLILASGELQPWAMVEESESSPTQRTVDMETTDGKSTVEQGYQSISDLSGTVNPALDLSGDIVNATKL